MAQIASNYMVGKRIKTAHFNAIYVKLDLIWSNVEPSAKGGVAATVPALSGTILAATLNTWRLQIAQIYANQVFSDGTAAAGEPATFLSAPTIDVFTAGITQITSVQFAQLWNAVDQLLHVGFDILTGGGYSGDPLPNGGSQWNLAYTRFYDFAKSAAWGNLGILGGPWASDWQEIYDWVITLDTQLQGWGDMFVNEMPGFDVGASDVEGAELNVNWAWMEGNNPGLLNNEPPDYNSGSDIIAAGGGPAWNNALGPDTTFVGGVLRSDVWVGCRADHLLVTWNGSAWATPGVAVGDARYAGVTTRIFITYSSTSYHNTLSQSYALWPQHTYLVDSQWDPYGAPTFAPGTYILPDVNPTVIWQEQIGPDDYPNIDPHDGGAPPGPGVEPSKVPPDDTYEWPGFNQPGPTQVLAYNGSLGCTFVLELLNRDSALDTSVLV